MNIFERILGPHQMPWLLIGLIAWLAVFGEPTDWMR